MTDFAPGTRRVGSMRRSKMVRHIFHASVKTLSQPVFQLYCGLIHGVPSQCRNNSTPNPLRLPNKLWMLKVVQIFG